jgi:predicted ArsR family transcriptional regulator
MRIAPDALVAGFPARAGRELLRQSDEFLSRQDATKILGLHGKKAVQALGRLEREGFIERNTSVPDSNAEH